MRAAKHEHVGLLVYSWVDQKIYAKNIMTTPDIIAAGNLAALVEETDNMNPVVCSNSS